jgi:hypothetical protein
MIDELMGRAMHGGALCGTARLVVFHDRSSKTIRFWQGDFGPSASRAPD